MVKIKPISSPSFELLKYTADFIRQSSFSGGVDDAEFGIQTCVSCHRSKTVFDYASNLYCCKECGAQNQTCVFANKLGVNNKKRLKDALKHQAHKAVLQHLHYTFLIKKQYVNNTGALVSELIKMDEVYFKRSFVDEGILISVDGFSLIVLKRILKTVGIKIKLLNE